MNISTTTVSLSANTSINQSHGGGNRNNSSQGEVNDTTKSPYPAQVVVMWSVPLLVVLLNLLVFIVAPRMKTLRGATTKCGILSLAISDFSLGVVQLTVVSYNTYTGYPQHPHLICVITGYSQALFAGVSIATLTFMIVDRLLTFAYPIRYRTTKRTVITIQVVIWISIISLLVPTAIGNLEGNIKYHAHAFICLPDWSGDFSYKMVVLTLLFIIPTVVIVLCFCGSFYYARSGHRQVNQRTLRGTNAAVHYGGNATKRKAASQWRRDRRILKTLTIMTFGFYVAWLPYVITIALPEMTIHDSLHPVTDFITPWLAGSNSFWNPIIYIPTMRPFSKSLCMLWRSTSCVKHYILRKSTTGGGTSGEAPTLASSSSNSGDGTSKGAVDSSQQRQHQSCTRF